MTFLSSIVKTILLGIIQGITEWLPISSTGHLILFASIWPLEPATFFESVQSGYSVWKYFSGFSVVLSEIESF